MRAKATSTPSVPRPSRPPPAPHTAVPLEPQAQLGQWADTQPGGEAIHDAFFRAYFVDARDISDVDVMRDIVKSVGLSVDAAREVLDKRTFKDAVDEDWKLWRQYGITRVPTFVVGNRGRSAPSPTMCWSSS